MAGLRSGSGLGCGSKCCAHHCGPAGQHCELELWSVAAVNVRCLLRSLLTRGTHEAAGAQQVRLLQGRAEFLPRQGQDQMCHYSSGCEMHHLSAPQPATPALHNAFC